MIQNEILLLSNCDIRFEMYNNFRVSSENNLFQLHSQRNLSVWNYPDPYCKCSSNDNGTSVETCNEQLYPSLYCVDSGYESFETVCRRNVRPGQHTKILPVWKVKAPVTKVFVK